MVFANDIVFAAALPADSLLCLHDFSLFIRISEPQGFVVRVLRVFEKIAMVGLRCRGLWILVRTAA